MSTLTRLDLPVEQYAVWVGVDMDRERHRRARWNRSPARRESLQTWSERRFLRRLQRDGGHAVDDVTVEFDDRMGDDFIRNRGRYRMAVRAVIGWPADEPWPGIRVGSAMISVAVPAARTRARGHGMEADDESQDELDGAALRQLREALPKGTFAWIIEIHGGRDPKVSVEGWASTGQIHKFRLGTGDSIAEAADACRERLTRR